MNYREEQLNELEALQAIYPDELSVLSPKDPVTFSILVKNEVYQEANDINELDSYFEARLSFSFPNDYPDEKPEIEIENSLNLDRKDESELLDLLVSEASDNLGMVMVFTLVFVAKEWINKKCDEKKRQREEREEREKREEEELEMKKFEGTRVTVESFLAWKQKFEAEMLISQVKIKQDPGSRKLTGKELFERDRSLNESDLQFLDEIECGDDNGVKVDESLFENLDDLELELENLE